MRDSTICISIIPVVEVVKEKIELASSSEALCFGDEVVVSRVKLGGEPSKHGRYGKIKFVMSIK